IDMRLVWPGNANEPENKLNRLIANVHRIYRETGHNLYRRADGTPFPQPGAGQLIFSDLGTLSVEEKRGFSAYRWIKQELVRLGIPAGEIAYMQDYRRSADKQRLFNDFNAGRIRILIGSSDTMGTGVNVQLRLKALHHLDVPWLPSQIEQREGRIERATSTTRSRSMPTPRSARWTPPCGRTTSGRGASLPRHSPAIAASALSTI